MLNEIVSEGGYILARSLFNMSVGIMQIVGCAADGALIAFASARGTSHARGRAPLIRAGFRLASTEAELHCHEVLLKGGTAG